MRLCRPAAFGLGLLICALGMALSACAGVRPASAPGGQAAPAATAAHTAAHTADHTAAHTDTPIDTDTACAASLRTGGAAPPTIAHAELHAKVNEVMRRRSGAAWAPGTAVALREALCVAGIWRQPGLDVALSPWGLSVKQIEVNAATLDVKPAQPAAAASAAARRIPPRE